MANPRTPGGSWRRTLALLRPYRGAIVGSWLLAAGVTATSLAIPYLTKIAVDDGIRADDRTVLLVAVLVILGVALVRMALGIGRRILLGAASLRVEYDLRNRMFNHLLTLSARWYDGQQTGQLVSRGAADVQGVRTFLSYGLLFLFTNLLTLAGALVLMLLVDWPLALLSFAITPLVTLVALRYSTQSRPILRDAQQRLAELTATAEETIVGLPVVRAFAQEDARQDAFELRSRRVMDFDLMAAKLRAVYVPLLTFLPTLALAVVLYVGGRRVASGALPVGSFVAFNGYLLLLVIPMRALGALIGWSQRALASAERVFEILDTPADIADAPDARPLPDGDGAVRLDDVHVTRGTQEVLTGLSLDVPAGTTVALVGRSGSGKTTLLDLLPRLYDPDAGRVLVDGQDVAHTELDSLRRAIGVVSAEPFLFSLSVADNIAFGRPDATRADVEAAARRAQADRFVAELPDGYDTVIGERGLTLSGGQRQRLAIARALLLDPRVLVLDDATSSVDARTEAEIASALAEVMEGRTTILVGHRRSTIRLAERVVVLDGGRVAAEGTDDELLATSPLYRSIVEPDDDDIDADAAGPPLAGETAVEAGR